jgi:leader peptidase (prepilin peptidase)/N-methyltransferase
VRETFLTVFFGLSGAVVGSFLNVVIWRLPRGQNLAHPRSACPRCGALIRWFDNVPVLSWLLLRARCRGCKAAISARYPLVEALTAALFVLAYRSWGPDMPTSIAVCAVLAALVAISFIDLDHKRIPDVITKPGMVLGVVCAPFLALHPRDWIKDLNPGMNAFFHAGAGLIAGYLLILAIRILGKLAFRKEAMGLGDAKLLAFVGAFTGPQAAVYALILACLAGAVIGIALFVIGKRRPVACTGIVESGGQKVEIRGVRFRDGDVWVPLPQGTASGAPAKLRLVLPASKILEDADAEVDLTGTVVDPTEGPRGTPGRVRLDTPSEEDRERLEMFSHSYRYVPFGPFLSIGGAVALLFGPELDWWITVGYPRWAAELFKGLFK